jgi:hypothetical protein
MASSMVAISRSRVGRSKIPPELDEALLERPGVQRREVGGMVFRHGWAEGKAGEVGFQGWKRENFPFGCPWAS